MKEWEDRWVDGKERERVSGWVGRCMGECI